MKLLRTTILSLTCLFSTGAFAHNRYGHSDGQRILATYYNEGRVTANGERFNRYGMTAAHRTLPFGTVMQVTNPKNDRRVVVRINDRGPYHRGYSLDLSEGAARRLGFSAGPLFIKLLGFHRH